MHLELALARDVLLVGTRDRIEVRVAIPRPSDLIEDAVLDLDDREERGRSRGTRCRSRPAACHQNHDADGCQGPHLLNVTCPGGPRYRGEGIDTRATWPYLAAIARSDKTHFPSHRERDAVPVPLPALAHDYLEDVEIRGNAGVTAKHYGSYLRTFIEWLAFHRRTAKAALTTADVDAEGLRTYQLFLARRRHPRTGRPIVAATRNLYVTAVRELLKYARHRHDVEVPDPDDSLPRAKERDVEIRRLRREEFDRMREAIELSKPGGLRDRAILEALFGSGARVSEVAGLTVRALDLRRREVQIIGKGSKSRLVFLTEEAAAWIERYLATRRDDCPAAFVTVKGKKARALGVRQIERIVERAARRAGLPFRVSPHWLRHSRLTIVSRFSGVEVAQRVAGHASLQTTARYLHVSDSHLRALYDKAERADRGDDTVA